MSCSACEKKYKACIDNINERNTLHMDVAQSILYDLRKDQRQTFKEELLKKVCSLRNSRGGILVIHVTDRDQDCGPSLDKLDEVEDDLSNMIEDDTPFCENYTRYWIDGCQVVESHPSSRQGRTASGAGHRYTDYILLHVSASGSISTRDYNTFMPWYGSTHRPKARELAGVLTRVSTETKPREEKYVNKQEIKVKGREKKRLLSGYESRDVQFKRLRLTDSQKKTESNDGNNIREQNIKYIINRVMDRLYRYVTAFTKLTEGGAIYYGIEEEKGQGKGQGKGRKIATRSQTGDGPRTHHYVVNGIPMSPDMKGVVEAEIKSNITKNMLWHNEQGDNYEKDEINNLVEISFHSTSEAEEETAVGKEETSAGTAAGKRETSAGTAVGKEETSAGTAVVEEDTYVIEVRVKGNFRGIAFTSKTGPCAYRLDDKRDTMPVDTKDWEKRIKLLATNSPAQPVTSSPQAGQ